ncbi:flagellar biosynthetic protein FliR [Vagococcus salmoninarum]|uniref:Flagellar biosynthetic protein FliR n=1 Tax=Vagococcus salmoninarum TaxID=2739 RepID=A0A429ZST4_9ENTE|nr:flagellar biosynthetic protein FliR [Vagococcus salmoninarum]RST96801.1 flagellar biosynthetic protein FliR [Vagococcus salmoninarum]
MAENLINLLLIFSRISAFIVISPGFSFKSMPTTAKVCLALALTLAVNGMSVLVPLEISSYLLLFYLVREVLVGLAMGFISQLIFTGIEIAGQFIDFQVGFAMGAMFDPATGVHGSNYGRLYYWLALAVFFLTDMHHLLIQSLLDSFQVVPIGTATLSNYGIEGTIMLFSVVFKIALGLGAPMMIVALISDIVLGIISKSVPQINVLMLGMPLKILVSFFFMLLLLPNVVQSISKVMPLISQYLEGFVKSLTG